MRIYRFELSFDGEQQDIGLLQGWSDTLAPSEYYDGLRTVFETLPAPMLDEVENGRIVFWFTETGLCKFREDLQIVMNVVWNHSPWGVMVSESEASEEVLQWAVYRDDWQIAWRYEDVHSCGQFCLDYHEIHALDEINRKT